MSFVAHYISDLDLQVHWPIMNKIYTDIGPVDQL